MQFDDCYLTRLSNVAESGYMSGKAAKTYIMVLSQHIFGGTERNHGKRYSE
jgi:hypothetical protein